MSRIPGPEDGDRPDGPMTDPRDDAPIERGPDEVRDPQNPARPDRQPPSVPGEHAPGTQVDRGAEQST